MDERTLAQAQQATRELAELLGALHDAVNVRQDSACQQALTREIKAALTRLESLFPPENARLTSGETED